MLATTGCFEEKNQPTMFQASTNAAYLQGQADAKVSFQQVVGALQGVQHDIRVLVTNQMLLNGRLQSLERLQKAKTDAPATNAAPAVPVPTPAAATPPAEPPKP